MNLAELLRATKGDRSYEELERLCGGVPSAQRMQQMATSDLRAFPDPPSIRGLSRGLGVGERTVVLAAAESLGLEVGEDPSPLHALLPPHAADLSAEQVAAVLQLIRAFTPAEADPAGSPEPAMPEKAVGTARAARATGRSAKPTGRTKPGRTRAG